MTLSSELFVKQFNLVLEVISGSMELGKVKKLLSKGESSLTCFRFETWRFMIFNDFVKKKLNPDP